MDNLKLMQLVTMVSWCEKYGRDGATMLVLDIESQRARRSRANTTLVHLAFEDAARVRLGIPSVFE